MEFNEWIEWWNKNYKLSIGDRMVYLDFSVMQNLKGSKKFLKYITNIMDNYK